MKSKSILQEAAEIRKFIEKNRKLPTYCTVEGNQLSVYTTTYLITRLISKITKSSVNLVAIKKPSNMVSWKVDNLKVLKADYMDMIRRFDAYCNKNRQVPAYIVTKQTGTKVGFELFVYCVCKIAHFYKENGYLPNWCVFDSKEFSNNKKGSANSKKDTTQSTSNTTKKTIYVSKPHLTNLNLGQDTSYNCAPNMLQQLFYKLSHKIIPERTIAAWCGTTSRGTDHSGINTAIQKFAKTYNLNLKTTWKYYSDFGNTTAKRMKAIGELMSKSNTAVGWHILYCDSGEKTTGGQYGHYEVIDKINTQTQYVRALNSLGIRNKNGSYQGHLQDRPYHVQDYYAKNTPGNQKAVLIITKT